MPYPDVLEGSAVLTTKPSPIQVNAPAAARLAQLYCSDDTPVTAGQALAELENGIGLHAILMLGDLADSVLTALQRGDTGALARLPEPGCHTLGDGQQFYNSLVDALNAYMLQQRTGIYARRAEHLRRQLGAYASMAAVSAAERRLIDEELVQAGERFAASEALYRSKVISRQEYAEEAARLREKKLGLESQKAAGLQHGISIAGGNRQLIELQFDREERERQLLSGIREQVRNLQNFTQDWKLKYLLTAPCNGTVHFARAFRLQEQLTAGEPLYTVVPDHYHYSASLRVRGEGAGKLAPGQEVQLLLDQYPAPEFGYISGRISRIALLPQITEHHSFYRVDVALPDSLRTSHHRLLLFTGAMTGQARIVVRSRNLLQRCLSVLSGAVRR